MTPRALVCVKTIFFALVVQLTTTVGSLVIGGCCLPFLFLSPPTHRTLYDYFMAMWEALLVVCITQIIII